MNRCAEKGGVDFSVISAKKLRGVQTLSGTARVNRYSLVFNFSNFWVSEIVVD